MGFAGFGNCSCCATATVTPLCLTVLCHHGVITVSTITRNLPLSHSGVTRKSLHVTYSPSHVVTLLELRDFVQWMSWMPCGEDGRAVRKKRLGKSIQSGSNRQILEVIETCRDHSFSPNPPNLGQCNLCHTIWLPIWLPIWSPTWPTNCCHCHFLLQ